MLPQNQRVTRHWSNTLNFFSKNIGERMSVPLLMVFSFSYDIIFNYQFNDVHRLKAGPGRTLDLRKNGLTIKRIRSKNQTSRSKTLSFVSCHMKYNVEVLYFQIKSRDVESLVFVQITFERCTINFYFKNGEVSVKTTIANLQPLLVWNISACLRIFMRPRFQ